MPEINPVFKETYRNYLKKIDALDLEAAASKLGLMHQDGHFSVQLFHHTYYISKDGFHSVSGQRAPYEAGIMLSRYLLMCPAKAPEGNGWAAFRDFKDSGPLAVYFTTEVENLICNRFSGKTAELEELALSIGGSPADDLAGYDLAVRFDALPKIPVLLLFNDADEEFKAQAKVLFGKTAESYLDAECLAILGNYLYRMLTVTDAKT